MPTRAQLLCLWLQLYACGVSHGVAIALPHCLTVL
jgi:hypothetical protein